MHLFSESNYLIVLDMGLARKIETFLIPLRS
jgi:hypothetical protein